MKTIPLRQINDLKTTEIIRPVIERTPQGANVGEIRARVRVLDALEHLPIDAVSLSLEDADHATLVRAVNTFQFGAATKDLLTIIDDILDAK